MLPAALVENYAKKLSRESGVPSSTTDAEAAILATIEAVVMQYGRSSSFVSYTLEE